MKIACLALAALFGSCAYAGGGPFGIDSQGPGNASGIWSRGHQRALEAIAIGVPLAGALWEGSDSRFGRTLWQSVDSMALAGVGYSVLNNTFRRLRPSQTSDPGQWFKRGGHSFPSGEVSAISSAVTPIVLEYGRDHPAAWALELLPAYDAIARWKSRGHWQSDVIAAWALGTATGWYAHSRSVPISVIVLPRSVTIGISKRF